MDDVHRSLETIGRAYRAHLVRREGKEGKGESVRGGGAGLCSNLIPILAARRPKRSYRNSLVREYR